MTLIEWRNRSVSQLDYHSPIDGTHGRATDRDVPALKEKSLNLVTTPSAPLAAYQFHGDIRYSRS